MAEAELPTIARPYARAAFSRALDQANGLETWFRMLNLLAVAVSEPIVEEALDNPIQTIKDEIGILLELMRDDLNQDGQNFVSVLAENGRLALLPTIFELFALLKANHEKTMDVAVASAFDVSDEEKTELGAALQRMLQRNINLETEVDKSLIGGVVIRTENTVIDDSVKGRLEKLSQVLG
ncbi:F0F1 ATP synthase subunit delta [Gammaproteobacteria bacterium]|nr:F0F1 ATP synthase subunit delta [Gammaproteobacteria bacterium]